jgi:hypothetical protein
VDGGLLAVAVAWAVCSLFETLYFGLFYWLLYGLILSAGSLPAEDLAAPAKRPLPWRYAPPRPSVVPCPSVLRLS